MSNRRRLRGSLDRHAVVAALTNRATLRETTADSRLLDQLVAGAPHDLTARQALNTAQILAVIAREYGKRLPIGVRVQVDTQIAAVLSAEVPRGA